MTYYLSDGMLNLTHSPKPKFHLARHVKSQHIRRVEPVKLVMSSVLSRAFRQALHSQNAWPQHVERVEMRRAKYNLGFTPAIVKTDPIYYAAGWRRQRQ